MNARARRFIDDWAWCWTGGTHERKGQAAAPSHPITRQPHRPVMQYSQEQGTHRHLKHQLSRATKPKSHPSSNT